MWVIGLIGLSESGKSSVCSWLYTQGVPHIKIVKHVRALWETERNGNGTIADYHLAIETDASRADRIVDSILAEAGDCEVIEIQSMVSPMLARRLWHRLGNRFLSLYLEVPESTRIAREATKTHQPLEIVQQSVRQKDSNKRDWGLDELKRLSVVIDNSGSFQQCSGQILNILAVLGIPLGPKGATGDN
ncbi:MAG: hypothetical protein ACYCOU_24620 [Sulfobacillus sp.]